MSSLRAELSCSVLFVFELVLNPDPFFRPGVLGPGQGGVTWSWRGVRNYTPHLFVGRNGRSQAVGFKKQNLVKKLKIKAEQNVR